MTAPSRTGASNWTARQWLLISFLSVTVILSSITTVDQYAESNYESLFRRALVTFALARTLNGLISAVQGTELTLAPAGVGVTLTPGEILDPVNDLVERFSWIMLGATISLGVQQVLLDMGQWWVIRVLVALSGLLWLWAMLGRSRNKTTFPVNIESALIRTFLVVLFLRFAVPCALIANEGLFDLFLQSRYTESTQVIETAGADFEQISDVVPLEEGETQGGIMGAMGRALESARNTLDLNSRIDYIKNRAADVIEHLIQLSVVFILQTAVLPITFLWLMMYCLKMLLK